MTNFRVAQLSEYATEVPNYFSRQIEAIKLYKNCSNTNTYATTSAYAATSVWPTNEDTHVTATQIKYAAKDYSNAIRNIWFTNDTTCTDTTSNNYVWQNYIKACNDRDAAQAPKPLPLPDRLKQIMEARQSPIIIIGKSKALNVAEDAREARARQTMRRVLGDDGYERFRRKGFVSVQAKSGRFYQIFPGHGFTNVYENGKMIERLCVIFKSAESFPPTDSLIMRYLLIINDEEKFWSLANKHSPILNLTIGNHLAQSDQRSLVDIMADLRSGHRLVA